MNFRREFEVSIEHGFEGKNLRYKRERGQASCAECRRLKSKCDKKIPCKSCKRRGCAHICPTGIRQTSHGVRFVLAATGSLQRRVARLNSRIFQLEDALGILYSQYSSEIHPLLRDDSDRLYCGEDFLLDDELDGFRRHALPKFHDAFGTLSISDIGTSRYFGPAGASQTVLYEQPDSSELTRSNVTHNTNNRPSVFPTETKFVHQKLFSRTFPFIFPSRFSRSYFQQVIESYLPPFDEAKLICETYYDQLGWFSSFPSRGDAIDKILPAIYARRDGLIPAEIRESTAESYSSPHDVALLFILLAAGSILKHFPSVDQAEHFFQLATAAVSLKSVLENPSVKTIQMLYLMSAYNAMAGSDSRNDTSIELTWALNMMAVHLSQSIGLHRESTNWGFLPQDLQQRRFVFWTILGTHTWECLMNGRPLCFSLPYIDCGFKTPTDDGRRFWSHFTIEVVTKVALLLESEQPSYEAVLELDNIMRNFGSESIDNGAVDKAASMRLMGPSSPTHGVSLYLHRFYFAQAIMENPEDPLKSVYAASFLASYRAASVKLNEFSDRFTRFPLPCSRIWMFWIQAFSATLIFGTIVTKAPRSSFAQPAMVELKKAHYLFEKASTYHIRATKALPFIKKLMKKAENALDTVQEGFQWNFEQTVEQGDNDDELSLLAGQTRVVYTGHPQQLEKQLNTTGIGLPPDCRRQESQFLSPSETKNHQFRQRHSRLGQREDNNPTGRPQSLANPMSVLSQSTPYISRNQTSLTVSYSQSVSTTPSRNSPVPTLRTPGHAVLGGTRNYHRTLESTASQAKLSQFQNEAYSSSTERGFCTSLPHTPDTPTLNLPWRIPFHVTADDNYLINDAQITMAPPVQRQHSPEKSLFVDLGFATRHSEMARRWESFLNEDSEILES